MSPELLPEEPQQPQGLGEASRLTGVFFEPGKAFADVAERPGFWVPLLLTIVVSLVYLGLFSQHVGWERMIRHQMETNARVQQLSAEQRETQLQLSLKITPYAAFGGVALGIPIGLAIWAGVLLLIVKVMMSVPVNFKQVFSILCYAGLPGIVMALLAIAVMFLKPPEDFNLQNPLVFNPGAFMDPAATSKFVHSVASALDLFRLWTLVLTAIGLKAAGGRQLSMGGAATAVFVPWALWTLIGASLAGLFS